MNTNEINYTVYEGAIIQNSEIGCRTVIGTDAYVKNSNIAEMCRLERRTMVFDSEIGFGSQIGYNTIVRDCVIGKFCSISWGGGGR